MDEADADKLAFALLVAVKWAVDGGNIAQLPKVHEEMSDALRTLGNVPTQSEASVPPAGLRKSVSA
jgi:hypothetical protein